MSEKNVKKRNWAFVLYEESAPPDWREILQKTGLQCAVSPYHDKDFDEGKPKKPHYHIILCYSGPTSFNVVKRLTTELNQPIPIPLEQVKGYYRYLTHKDNPDKAQYNSSEIMVINGFSIADFTDMTRSEILRFKKTIQGLILDYNITEYSFLMDYLLHNDSTGELYEVACNNTVFFNTYIKSKRHAETQPKKT